MADYLERVADGLHKKCGERPHSLKIDDDTNKHYQSEDSPFLKRSVDKLMGKMEVISTHLLSNVSVSHLNELFRTKIKLKNAWIK
jgi:hypothetical protein